MAAHDYLDQTDEHKISGWLPGYGDISMPLVSHVEGNLWLGGCVDGVRLGNDFLRVVSLTNQEYVLGPDTIRVQERLWDAAFIPDEALLNRLADTVVRFLGEGKTLVHCQAGLNRSGLVAGLALVKMGQPPAEAIALLRAARHDQVLCNQTFASWLLRQ